MHDHLSMRHKRNPPRIAAAHPVHVRARNGDCPKSAKGAERPIASADVAKFDCDPAG